MLIPYEDKDDDYDDGDDDHDGDDYHDDCKCGATSGLGRTCLNIFFWNPSVWFPPLQISYSVGELLLSSHALREHPVLHGHTPGISEDLNQDMMWICIMYMCIF